MRLMGNAALGVGPNTTETLVTVDQKTKNLSNDPGMPKVTDSTAVIELPGQANAAIQQYIIANTKDGSGYIPGQSQYIASNPGLNATTTTNTPPSTQTQTANCANNDLACRSGVGVQQNAPLSQQTREAIADGASTLSRQAGVIAAGATAIGSQVGPYAKPAQALAVGATAVGIGADIVEQAVRPDAKQVIREQLILGVPAEVLTQRFPILAPVINEIKEGLK